MLDASQIVSKCQELRRQHAKSDTSRKLVKHVRDGEMSEVFDDFAIEGIDKPIIANFVEACARDVSELIAPLPAINCSSGSMATDRAKKFADRRAKIVSNYFQHSKVDLQMYMGADQYISYATTVFYLDADFENRMPRITIEDAMHGYPEIDRYGRVQTYSKRWWAPARELAQLFPEYSEAIADASHQTQESPGGQCELIRYCDKDMIGLVLVSKTPRFLALTKNLLGETPVVLARRMWLNMERPRGQFDDVIYVQLARDILAKLNLEAVHKAVTAPIALPTDVQEMAIGPDARMRSQSPEKIRRVELTVPPSAFTESSLLMQEMQMGARYPNVRSGGTDASIITGKGVQALMGGFDTQIKAAQASFAQAFKDVARLCFKMDEKYWPDVEKTVRGVRVGTPFEITYTPRKDIAGEYHTDVSYGFAAGLDPNRAVVLLLQLLGADAISKDHFMRQLPFAMDVTEELNKISLEKTREALLQGIFGYVQALPAMAQSGMNPSEPVMKVAKIIQGLKKGDPIEDVISETFAPVEPSGGEEIPGASPVGQDVGLGGAAGVGAGGGSAAGLSSSGRMAGVPIGQAGQQPGGRPDLNILFAGLNGNGNPNLTASVLRRRAG